MKQDIIRDISSLTAVPIKTLNKLIQISELCICDGLNELDKSDDDILTLDIGIGTITLLIIENSIEYSFCPSNSLETKIIDTLEEKSTPLVNKLETNLENKLLATYKELL